jgi:hypothetical protein
LFWAKGLFGKTHPYANLLYFFSHLFWYLAKRALCNIRKFQKKLFWILLNLFVGPSHFYFSFFDDFTIYLL